MDVWQKALNQTNDQFWTGSSDRSFRSLELVQILYFQERGLDNGRLYPGVGSLQTRFLWHRTYRNISCEDDEIL